MAELISIDDTIDTAYDIFLEMAPDNLEPADVILFTAQFDDAARLSWSMSAMTGMTKWVSKSIKKSMPKYALVW